MWVKRDQLASYSWFNLKFVGPWFYDDPIWTIACRQGNNTSMFHNFSSCQSTRNYSVNFCGDL